MSSPTSDEIQQTIIAAAIRYHIDHDTWPTRAVVARITHIHPETVRYHCDLLIERGDMRRGPGGIIQILNDGRKLGLPVKVIVLDELIIAAVQAEHDQGVQEVSTSQILARIPGYQRQAISRRCRALVNAHRLEIVGHGYRIPKDEATE